MSVRRLADDQPASFEFTPENLAWAQTLIARYPQGKQASAVIPLLWRAQEQHDYWLPRPAIEKVADMLGMNKLRVLEVATFYTMFNLAPVGRHFIQLCGTPPCHVKGAPALRRILEARIGEQQHITPDGKFSWLEVECLGACCNAPMVQINNDYYEDLTDENFNKLLDDLAAGVPVKKGSQIGRVSSEPIPGKADTLNDPALYDGSRVGAWRKRFEDEQAKTAAPAAAAPAPAVPAPVARPAPVAAPAAAAADPEAAAREATAAAEEQAIRDKLATLSKDATPEEKANAVGRRPAGLASPRGGVADDLKRIKGVGKVNEARLNELGVFHFDQISVWSRDEVRWVGTYLSFPGRIDREDWRAQAAVLAKGGETEFSRRVDKGDIASSTGGPSRPDKVK